MTELERVAYERAAGHVQDAIFALNAAIHVAEGARHRTEGIVLEAASHLAMARVLIGKLLGRRMVYSENNSV